MRSVGGENDLGIRKDLRGELDLVLADTPYSVQSYRKDVNVEYDVFSSSNKKDMTKVPGDVIMPGADGNVLRSALQPALGHKALASVVKTEKLSASEDSREEGSESKEIEGVERRPTFEVENSNVHHVRAVEKYQQTTAAKLATNLSGRDGHSLSAVWGVMGRAPRARKL